MAAIVTLTLNPALDVFTGTESVRPTHKLRCTPPRFEPGGGGINVARVVHALGGEVTAVFPCGGSSGMAFEKLLRESGVPIAPVPIAGATRESFTVDEEESGEQYRFVLPGPSLSDEELEQILETVGGVEGPPAYVIASGSLPPDCDPQIFRRLCALCGRIGARLVIDTSGDALAAVEGSCAFLIKPSLREVQELVGRELPDAAAECEAARELLARCFADVIVVSLGDRGALLVADGCRAADARDRSAGRQRGGCGRFDGRGDHARPRLGQVARGGAALRRRRGRGGADHPRFGARAARGCRAALLGGFGERLGAEQVVK